MGFRKLSLTILDKKMSKVSRLIFYQKNKSHILMTGKENNVWLIYRKHVNSNQKKTSRFSA